MLKGTDTLVPHNATQAPPLSPTDIMVVCDYLVSYLISPCLDRVTSSPRHRQSGRGVHTLRRADVMERPHGLTVLVRSSRTISHPSWGVALMVPHLSQSPYCPVSTWRRYRDQVQLPPYEACICNRSLTATSLVAVAALSRAGTPYAHKVSMQQTTGNVFESFFSDIFAKLRKTMSHAT